MENFLHDVRYGIRMMAKSPAFTAIAVVTLALGIGANTAIFSMVSAVLLRPLPYPEPDRIMRLYEQRPKESLDRNVVSPADFLDWRAQADKFEAMAAYIPNSFNLTGRGEPEHITGVGVTLDFFKVFGAQPLHGRIFVEGEDQPGRGRVIVLSHRYWASKFDSDPAAVGQSLNLNGVSATIIGVMPPEFEFPISEWVLWAPLSLADQVNQRGSHYLNVVGKLKTGVTMQEASAQLATIGARLEKDHPVNNGHGPQMFGLHDDMVEDARRPLFILLGAVVLVLLIASSNVANLLLTRDLARRREFAVRAALGATRLRILRQSLTESLMLSLLGAGAGVLLAVWGVEVITRMIPPFLLPLIHHSRVDVGVLAFTTVVATAAALVFGAAPAFAASRNDLAGGLKEAAQSTTAGGGRSWFRNALIGGEVAVAIVLLAGAAVLIKSFLLVQRVDPGFNPESVTVMSVSLPRQQYTSPAQVSAFTTEALRRLRELPGVMSVGGINILPVSGGDMRRGFAIEGREPGPEPTRAHPRVVTPGYFGTMGIRLLAGRDFTDADSETAPAVIVVNETTAKRYFPDVNPVGRRMGFNDRWWEIVGVIGDVKHWGLEEGVNPEVYFSHRQFTWNEMTLAVRSTLPLDSIGPSFREQIAAIDKTIPVANLETMENVIDTSLAGRRFNTVLMGIFAGLALALAALGLYGVVSHATAQRTREFGIRVALGATPADLRRLVMGRALFVVGVGAAAGIVAALFSTRVLKKLLFHVEPQDLTAYAAIVLVLATAAAVASFIPARRATKVDPMVALRYE